jgi:hypothetical protein
MMTEKEIRIRFLLLQEFRNGSSEDQAVSNICRNLGNNVVIKSTALFWFGRFRNGDNSLRNQDEVVMQQLISQSKGVIFERYDWLLNNGVTTVDGRMAFGFNCNVANRSGVFFAIDLFHGKIRFVLGIIKLSKSLESFRLSKVRFHI